MDRTSLSGWWRFIRLGRPMAVWTLLVWALWGVILVTLLSLVLILLDTEQ